MSQGDNITDAMLESLPAEHKHELLLLLQVRDRPRLARRIYPQPEPSPDRFDPDALREALESGIKRAEQVSPEEQAAEAHDEAELLEWFNRTDKSQKLDSLTQAIIRVARANRGEPAVVDLAALRKRQEMNEKALKAVKAKPAEPQITQEQDEPQEPIELSAGDIQRVPSSVYDAPGAKENSVMDDILERERIWRELHPAAGHGEWGT